MLRSCHRNSITLARCCPRLSAARGRPGSVTHCCLLCLSPGGFCPLAVTKELWQADMSRMPPLLSLSHSWEGENLESWSRIWGGGDHHPCLTPHAAHTCTYPSGSISHMAMSSRAPGPYLQPRGTPLSPVGWVLGTAGLQAHPTGMQQPGTTAACPLHGAATIPGCPWPWLGVCRGAQREQGQSAVKMLLPVPVSVATGRGDWLPAGLSPPWCQKWGGIGRILPGHCPASTAPAPPAVLGESTLIAFCFSVFPIIKSLLHP